MGDDNLSNGFNGEDYRVSNFNAMVKLIVDGLHGKSHNVQIFTLNDLSKNPLIGEIDFFNLRDALDFSSLSNNPDVVEAGEFLAKEAIKAGALDGKASSFEVFIQGFDEGNLSVSKGTRVLAAIQTELNNSGEKPYNFGIPDAPEA